MEENLLPNKVWVGKAPETQCCSSATTTLVTSLEITICNNSKTYYGDVKFREHLELVHKNGDKSFTDEEFSMLETWQLSEIRIVRKR